MAGPTHRVQRLPLRSVWPLEQQDFSQWLIENIDFLNGKLPFDIDPESLQAQRVRGSSSVDLLGEALDRSSGAPFRVVVENQINTSSHDHLGKLLTHAAAFAARAVVWISASARPEHAKAIQWINDETSLDAWLFDVDVIRIASSPPAPLLTQIVGPSMLSRKAKAERQGDLADRQHESEWWSIVLPTVAAECADHAVWQGRSPVRSVSMWEEVPRSPGSIRWEIWVTAHSSWIGLRIDGQSPGEAEHYYQGLLDQRAEIEEAFGAELQWKRVDKSDASLLRWDNPVSGGYRDAAIGWRDAAESLAEHMRRLVEATKARVQELDPYGAADEVSVEDVELSTDGSGDIANVMHP